MNSSVKGRRVTGNVLLHAPKGEPKGFQIEVMGCKRAEIGTGSVWVRGNRAAHGHALMVGNEAAEDMKIGFLFWNAVGLSGRGKRAEIWFFHE